MNADFVKAIALLAKEKGISPDVLYSAVEEALITAYKKNYGSAQNVRVSMHKETGEIHVYARKNIVEEVTDPTTEISLADAQKLNAHYQAGDILETEVTPKNFGRIAAQNAKQVIVQRIREAERGMTSSPGLSSGSKDTTCSSTWGRQKACCCPMNRSLMRRMITISA